MSYNKILKIHKGSDLIRNSSNMRKLYNVFSKTYVEATGVSFSENELRSRLYNWYLYGDIQLNSNGEIENEDRMAFVSYLPEEETNIFKVNSIVGNNPRDKFFVMRKFQETYSAHPIYTAVTKNVGKILERFGMINLSTVSNLILTQGLVASGFIPGAENASVAMDGGLKIKMNINNEEVSVKKYIYVNPKLLGYLYGYYKSGELLGDYDDDPLMRAAGPVLDAFFWKYKKEVFKKTEYANPHGDFLTKEIFDNTLNYDTSSLPTGENKDREFFKENLSNYSPKTFEQQYNAARDDKFLKENFIFVHSFGQYKTDLRVESNIQNLDRMINSFKNNNRNIDLSCYYINTNRSSVKDFLTKGMPSKGDYTLIIDGEVSFANTIDSYTKKQPYGTGKEFENFSKEVYETLFWDEKSYNEAFKNSFEDDMGEAILRNWSVTGIVINKAGAHTSSLDNSKLTQLSIKHNIPIYFISEATESAINPIDSSITIKEPNEESVTLEMKRDLKEKMTNEIGGRSNQYSQNIFDQIIDLESYMLIGFEGIKEEKEQDQKSGFFSWFSPKKEEPEETKEESNEFTTGEIDFYDINIIKDTESKINKLYENLNSNNISIIDQLEGISKKDSAYLLDDVLIDKLLLNKLKMNENIDENTKSKINKINDSLKDFELKESILFIENQEGIDMSKESDHKVIIYKLAELLYNMGFKKEAEKLYLVVK